MEGFEIIDRMIKERGPHTGVFVHLTNESKKRKKEFTKKLLNLHIESERWVDRLNCYESFARQPCNMNPKEYLSLISNSTFCTLKIKEEVSEIFRGKITKGKFITYGCRNTYKPKDKSNEYFLWYLCKFNKKNYKKINKIFRSTFGKSVLEYGLN